MSIKEMLFELKYIREGRALELWRQGVANRAGYHSKRYPKTPKDLFPDLFEKKKSIPMPDFLIDDYQKKINNSIRR